VIAVSSMCQPGRPGPYGLSQDGSPGVAAFQMTKSSGARFSGSTATRAPGRSASVRCPESSPYLGNFPTA